MIKINVDMFFSVIVIVQMFLVFFQILLSNLSSKYLKREETIKSELFQCLSYFFCGCVITLAVIVIVLSFYTV